MAEKPKVTKYQRLQKAATNHCKNGSPASKERLDKAVESYKADALKKGKAASEVNEIISRVKKCPVGVSGSKTTKKKTTSKARK